MQWKIKDVAWVGDDLLTGEITSVRLFFHGLGSSELRSAPWPEEEKLAAAGVLNVYPYYGPWSWMNRDARAFVDTLVERIYQEYGLSAEIPLFSTGGSMGGCSALLFARYTRHPLAACQANFPVGDTVYHFTERPDLPRTMWHAFGSYPEGMEAALEEQSPLHQVAGMPDIPYLIVHGDQDTAVNKARHSDRLVAAMRARGLRVNYIEVPGMGHGAIPEDIQAQIHTWLTGGYRG